MGLKLRFSLFFGFLLVCSLAGFSVLTYLQVRANLLATAERTLVGHLDHDALHLDHAHEKPDVEIAPVVKGPIYIRVWRDGVLIEDSFPEDPPPFTEEWGNQGDKIVRRFVENRNGKQYRVLGYYDLSATLEYLAALRQTLALGCLAALLFAIPLGLLASKALLSPFRRLSKGAAALGARSLSFRFPEPRHADEHGQLIRTFNSLLGRLEDAFGHTSRFASNASHELRTPLAVVISRAEIALRRPREAAELRRTLMDILAQAEHLNATIHRLLVLADIEKEETHTLTTAIPVRRTIEEALATLRHTLGEGSRSVELPPASEEIVVQANEPLLFSILSNLLENALKYAATSVRVSYRKQLSGLDIEIEDDGVGSPGTELEFAL